MSINRQKSRMRLNNNRDNTVYFNSFDSVLDSDPTTTVMPSIEESLQDWLSKNSSSQESDDNLFDMCQCCHQNDCKNHEFISKHIQKLENDIRLAAVIGQSLLQKHEHYVAESSIVKNRLEQEIELLQEKTRQLEQGLIESDNLKQIYLEEKMKSIWEYQKTQKTLDETTLDLDTCNNRCLKLSAELKNYINEVEKLRVFKLMARQADIQEDILNSKLEDVKQELAISRRAELMLESKLRKLKSKYETVSIAYEKLKVEQQEMSITKEFQLDVVWLKESNEKLRKEVLKV
ncbi:uncharacterized protein BX663DRAFT_513762 [Cokeromyces recurvatus]|uniref:uncharacterized protein n=1 Tax=Cokeromyces recurvatus TaxID=90255 RepID=UPI00221EC045|nr:uncharacterized protein BX663DRAFT_513762 [Cokeromyces recurvatus]KAI7901710.1 hypothetical protein BX663DRAFT_513762 [Cokeromyces recurvatus]